MFNALGGVVACGLGLLPHVAVWDNGGMLPWTRYWLAIAICALVVTALPIIASRRRIRSLESLGLPFLAMLAWGLAWAQTASLPAGIVAWISPGSSNAYSLIPTEIWDFFRKTGTPSLGGETATFFPTSVCVWMTQQAMFAPAVFGIVTLLAMFAFQTRRTLLFLMAVTASVGGLFSFLALVDTVKAISPGTNSSLITPDVGYGGPFGSFINRNGSALYMNLGLACTVGLLVYGVSMRRRTSTGSDAYDLPITNKLDALRAAAERFLKDADALAVGLVLLGVLQFVGILASNSRGGFLASLAGFAVAVIAGQKKSRYLWTVVPFLIATVAVVVLLDHLNLTETTQERVESIFTLEEGSQVGRLAHWSDSLRAAIGYFPAGAGLGTYSVAYLPFQTAMGDTWFYNADNMFMEWLVEGGVWLMTCVVAGTVLFVRALNRIRSVRGAAHLEGAAAMGWFLVGATCVSQFFDFGILYPANGLTLALLVGAILGADARPYKRRHRIATVPLTATANTAETPGNNERQWSNEKSRQWAIAALIVAYLAIGTMTIRWASDGAWADYKIRLLKPDGTDGIGFDEFAITEADQREFRELGNSQSLESPFLSLAIANSILADQSSRAVAQAPTNLSFGDMEQFQALSKIELRRIAFYEEVNRRGVDISPEAALLPGQSLAELKAARRLACEALVQCPLEIRPRWILLVTSFVENDSAEFTQLIADQTVNLWPNSGMIISRVARLVLPFPGIDSASPLFARVLKLNPSAFGALWPFIQVASDEATIISSLPDDPEALLVVIESAQVTQSLRQALIRKANELLSDDRIALPRERRAELRGRIAIRSGDRAVALTSFAEVVRLDPSNPEVRFLYAEALEAKGDINGAIEQIKRCLIQAPQNPGFLEGLRRLTHANPGS